MRVGLASFALGMCRSFKVRVKACCFIHHQHRIDRLFVSSQQSFFCLDPCLPAKNIYHFCGACLLASGGGSNEQTVRAKKLSSSHGPKLIALMFGIVGKFLLLNQRKRRFSSSPAECNTENPLIANNDSYIEFNGGNSCVIDLRNAALLKRLNSAEVNVTVATFKLQHMRVTQNSP